MFSRIHLIISLLSLISGIQSKAQTNIIHDDTFAEWYEESLHEIYLTKNTDGLIPLKQIDPNSIYILPTGNEIQEILPFFNWYTVINIFDNNLPINCESCILVIPQFKGMKLNESISQKILPVIQNLKTEAGFKVIWLNFDNINTLENEIVRDVSDAILYMSKDDKMQRSLTAQAIFGGQKIDAKLKKGDLPLSLASKKTRLGYGTPNTVGMDGRLLLDSIAKIAIQGIKSQAFPGAQVLVARKGQIIFHECYGYLTYDSIDLVQHNNIYDLASVTKISSALPALIKLYDEKKYDPDKSLSYYLPNFKKSNKEQVTGREMLAHQAQLIPHIPHWLNTQRKNGKYKWFTFKNSPSKAYSIKITDSLFLHNKYHKRMYKSIRKSPRLDEKEYVYSGLYFYLLPEIVSQLSGEDYSTYLQNEIFQPIGAMSLGFNPLDIFPISQIVPTELDTFWRHQLVRGRVHDEGAAMMGGVSANAGLFSNANDLAKLMQLYLNDGSYGGVEIFSKEAFRTFNSYQFPENNNRRGMGFDKPPLEGQNPTYISTSASPASFGHSGFTGTFVWADPEEELLIVFLSNRVYPFRSHRNLYQLNIRPRIHDILYRAILD